jgi:hypothetical protein
LFTDAPAKRAKTICPFWKSDSPSFCSSFIPLLNKTCYVLTLELQRVKWQKNNKRSLTSNALSMQSTQTSFIPALFSVSIILSFPCIYTNIYNTLLCLKRSKFVAAR